ncbi:hypothetical protein YC2023_083095 [Brassica napus]
MAEASAYSFRVAVQALCNGMNLNSPLRSSCASLTEKVISFVEIIGNYLLRKRQGNSRHRRNEENLTFPRVTLMVENGYRCRMISKNNLSECAGFSGWAKLGL